MKITVLCVLVICLMENIQGWKNFWDRPLNFKCPNRYWTISHVRSVHDNHREDRRYNISCTDLGDIGSVKCSWTRYANSFDHPVDFVCDGNGYVNGMYSYHDNRYEDRRHKYYCCKPEQKSYELTNCKTTGFLNEWDGDLNYNLPAHHVLRGVQSYYMNNKGDRRTKFKICRLNKIIGDRRI